MTEERRNYRDQQPESSTPPETPSQPSGPVPDPPRKDGTYKNITGLFRSHSGKADKATVTSEILEKLSKIKVGDVIGVSAIPRTDRIGLWYIEREPEKTPEAF